MENVGVIIFVSRCVIVIALKKRVLFIENR